MDPEAPRPLTEDESVLLQAILSHDFPGVEQLRAQARDLRAKSSCACGCGSIFLLPRGEGLSASSRQHTVPVSGHVLDDHGDVVGGVVLWLEEGFLSQLEVHWNDNPIPIPNVDNVEWVL